MEGTSHKVTQRWNRWQAAFSSGDDYRTHEGLPAGGRAATVAVWGYRLMPHHVHLVLVPGDADGLRAALSDMYRRYSQVVNFREG